MAVKRTNKDIDNELVRRNELISKALRFSMRAHADAFRKEKNTPYIVHPMEVAGISATFTEEPEVVAAALLHDTVEDAHVSPRKLRRKFGRRVEELVLAESEDKMEEVPASESWEARKYSTIKELLECDDLGVFALAFSDKLSNLRDLSRDYEVLGEKLWNKFNMKDPGKQKTYYASFLETCRCLKGTMHYEEYKRLVHRTFGKYRAASISYQGEKYCVDRKWLQ